jgi:HSP20 family protein
MASNLKVWSPFREMDRFRRDFDDLFNRFLGGTMGGETPATPVPAIESFVEAGRLVVRADLPGTDPKDVDITVSGDQLTIRGKREQHDEETGRDFIYREVSYGSFERTVRLPEGVKAEDVKASYQNGVLELSVPLPEQVTLRKVPIEIEGAARSPKR